MKHEWRKKEKELYLPGIKPQFIDLPPIQYLTIEGEGNPGSDEFPEFIAALYAVSYGIKMAPRKNINIEGFYDYTVYPLEGVWDINEAAKKHFDGTINKNDLVFKLMIRQPEFVTKDIANRIIEITKEKKPDLLIDMLRFERIEEGNCLQMLHLGSYDSEAESFAIMDEYAKENGYLRKSRIHKEIYLSDARRVSPEKLKTVLRFKVEKKDK